MLVESLVVTINAAHIIVEIFVVETIGAGIAAVIHL